jgi:hypothetical protein
MVQVPSVKSKLECKLFKRKRDSLCGLFFDFRAFLCDQLSRLWLKVQEEPQARIPGERALRCDFWCLAGH